jgi:hypothetical protein
MKKNIELLPEQVVGYYNLYNLYKLDNKDNKDNKYVEEVSSSTDIENTLVSLRSDLAPRSASQDIPASPIGSQPGCPQVIHLEEECKFPDEVLPILNEDMISRALIHFFDNGEGTPQRYKIKVRFNLVDKENPEFIATLGKDWSNFKKYIPTECRDEIIELARELRAKIKKEYNTTSYMGKFHLNIGKQAGQTKGFTNIEPNTLAFVWFDKDNEHWKYWIMFYGFIRTGTFAATHLTTSQIKNNVKGQDLYINPKYDTTQRPKTWAQRRIEQGNKK